MEKIKLNMGQKLKMFREINNLSQEELGKQLNVSDKTVSAWENEERDISLPNATLIADFFNLPKEYFVFDENENKIKPEIRDKIKQYLSLQSKINTINLIIANCKKKIETDGLPVKKEYLPKFNYEKNQIESLGIFDLTTLGIKSTNYDIDLNKANNINNYQYSSEALAKYNLSDILNRFNSNKVELKDLVNCNNLDIFKNTLASMKERKYTKKNIYNPFSEGYDISKEYIQNQLNQVLENLNPNLSNFWNIVAFLIDNGAYFTQRVGGGDDVVCWEVVKDISKTNYIYRIAKDNLFK